MESIRPQETSSISASAWKYFQKLQRIPPAYCRLLYPSAPDAYDDWKLCSDFTDSLFSLAKRARFSAAAEFICTLIVMRDKNWFDR